MHDEPTIPNHHRHYPGFSGASGLCAALSMVAGRDDDARYAVQLAQLRAGDVVVDVGCGPGAAARRAARLGASVTGVDPAAVMLRVARVLTRSRRVRYVQAGAESLPLPDDSATVVWSIATVHHWSDLDPALDEVTRVLRPGGRFVAIEHHARPGATGLASHGWTDAQADAFVRLCGEHGFAGARVELGPRSVRRPAIAVCARNPG